VTMIQSPVRSAGFTLVELVVVMLVAAILFAVGVPTYQAQVRHSRRTDAKTAVLDLAAREEKYFSLNNSYTSSAANLGYGSTATFPLQVGSGYYSVNACPAAGTAGTASVSTSSSTACLVASTATTGTLYVVSAVPVNSQVSDTPCQYFAVDNTGSQYADNAEGTGGTNTTSTCWQ